MKIRIKSKTEVFFHNVETEMVTIGRASENDFVIPLEDFSRKHCQVTFKGDYTFIMDLGSKNGVMIDGKRIRPNEQYPVYENSKITLANNFEFILPNGTSVNDIDAPLTLALEERSERKRR